MNMHIKADPAHIRELAAEGLSKSTIASILGVSRERIRQICVRDGIETMPGGRGHDLSDRMRDCAARGLTIQQAADELGRTVAGIYGKAKAEGITFAAPTFRWHEIRDAAAEGLTITQCARRMGCTAQQVWSEAKRHGVVFHATKRASRQSAIKGVSWIESQQRWRAYIYRSRKQIYLGSFATEAEAIAARKAAEAAP